MAERHTFVIDRHADGSLTLVDHVGPSVEPLTLPAVVGRVADARDTGRFRPCLSCGRSPDVHNPLRGRDYIGHEYR